MRFGITGILEDKELAALLGGLSGYILGRYSSPKAADAPDQNNFPQKPIAKIEISPTNTDLSEASPTVVLTAIASDKDGVELKSITNLDLAWVSDNPAVASVDAEGKVKRLGVGTFSITAASANIVSNKCTLTTCSCRTELR